MSSLCQCDKLHFPKMIAVISFTPYGLLQWILATSPSRGRVYFSITLNLGEPYDCFDQEDMVEVMRLLSSFCLGYLKCLPLGSSLLKPSHHVVRSHTIWRGWVRSPTKFFPNSQHQLPAMWMSHLGHPTLEWSLQMTVAQPMFSYNLTSDTKRESLRWAKW